MNNNTKTIVDVAVENGSFKTLVAAVTAAGLVETLNGVGPFTVLAPTDDAFAKIPAETLAMLLKPENIDKLKEILLYHVIVGSKVASTDLTNGAVVTMGNGKTLTVDLSNGAKFVSPVGAATVVIADVETSNGVIHAIDTVLMPE